jgi:uracil-DNA glycosylase family 4
MGDLNDEMRMMMQSLRIYLENLLDSGVDGLPLHAGEEHAMFEGANDLEFSVAGRAAGHGKYLEESSGEGAIEHRYPASVKEPKTETLEDIRAELENCCRCSLGGSRKNLVFGVGDPNADLVFVGEAPGRDEDLQGIPFVGRAGELLTSMINRMGFKRDDVYICNVLKCRPPNNRDPLPSEIETCHPYLLRQLKSLSPKAIVALGTFAAQTLLRTKEPISKLRGRFHDYHGIPLMPTFHPSFLLRNGPEMRWVVWEDMIQVLKKMGMPVPDIKRKK